jgi:hypothetical protein
MSKERSESRAILFQMSREVFKNTRINFQEDIKDYGRKNGMIFSMPSKTPFLIK